MSFDDFNPRSTTALEPFQVMRRAGLYGLTVLLALSAAAALGAVALLIGPVWLWGPAGLLVILAMVALPGVGDSKTPIFVADEYGVRLHNRDTWIGLLWNEMGVLIVEPRNGFTEPRIKIVAKDGRSTYSTPVGFTTNVSVADAEVQLARRRAAAAY
jgi:hypothetical protein